jgi:hypothetical protein
LEEEGQWGDHEIDGKMSYRGMQPTCSGLVTGRLQQEIGRSGGRRLGRPWPENGLKHHRRRRRTLKYITFKSLPPEHKLIVLYLSGVEIKE